MPIRLRVSHAEREFRHDVAGESVTIGRPKAGLALDLELPFDASVSRPHARVFVEGGRTFVEDLGSRWGTLVNGEEIRAKGPRPIGPGDEVVVGETTLRLARPEPGADRPGAAERAARRASATQTPAPRADAPRVTVTLTARASAPTDLSGERLEMLYDLPLALAEAMDGASEADLAQAIVERLVAVLPGVTRAGLLLGDGDKLLLAAHVAPAGASAGVSETLARRAMQTREAFVWDAAADSADVVTSMVRQRVVGGMYAPLVFGDKVLGALAADDPTSAGRVPGEADLRLLVAVARYAAMALANLRLREDVKREAAASANLARQFSPQVVEWMMSQKGRTRLGGSRLPVTVLASDVRGFTRQAATMEPDDVVDLLNAYFAVMVPIVHAHGGVVDKFIGDAILAIWGFPPPDDEQHLRAARAAVEMQAAIAGVTQRRAAAGLPTCGIGIGLHAGEVLQGFIGSADRQEFTVIGDAVNLASRLCDGAAAGEVLISPQLHQHVWKHAAVEPHAVPTKHEGDLRCHRLTGVEA